MVVSVRFKVLCLVLMFLLTPFSWASGSKVWVAVEVRTDREPALVENLEASGIQTIGWSNALVEISDFNSLQNVPLTSLKDRLTAGDPRWDPWLKGLSDIFHPKPGISRIWVGSDDRSKALGNLGAEVVSRGVGTPLSVTGWGMAAFSFLFFSLKFVSVWVSGSRSRRSPKAWGILAVTLLLVVAGIFLGTLGYPGPEIKGVAGAPTWTQHRWVQESLPFGASWNDWIPGKPWTYPSYAVKAGRLAEVPALLSAPDGLWSKEAFSKLDPHNPARIFGPENP